MSFVITAQWGAYSTLNYTHYDQITVRTTLVLLKNKKLYKWPNFRKQYIYVAKMTL